jgi:hypothetical protein
LNNTQLAYSALSRTVREGDTEVRIEICRLESTDWSLSVVDETGALTLWSELFPTEQAALDEAMKAIRKEGIETFLTGEKSVTVRRSRCPPR